MTPPIEKDIIAMKLDEHDEQLHVLNIAIFGDRDHVGINEDIRTIKRGTDLLLKLAWIVVGATIAVIVSGTSATVIYLIREMGKAR